MNFVWEHLNLKLEGVNDLEEVFRKEDIEFLEAYNQSAQPLITSEYFLMKEIPIFISDGSRKDVDLSVDNTFKYYQHKLNKVANESKNIYIYPFNTKSEKFERIEISYDFPDLLKEIIEEINVVGVSSRNLQIDPMFFNKLHETYNEYDEEYINYILKLRNFFSAFFLSNKIKVEGNDITLSYYNSQENIYNNLYLDWSDLKVSNIFNDILNWVLESMDDSSIFELKYRVARIYIANISDINKSIEEKDAVAGELSSLYDITLSRESQKFYEYQNMMSDEFFKLLQEKIKIITNKNKSSMNLIISFPIALYGVYLTTFQTNSEFELLSSQYIFVYFSFVIASVFMFVATLYEIYLLNENSKEVLKTIKNTYNVKIEEWENKTKISWWKDFRFPLISLFLIIVILAVLLFLSYNNADIGMINLKNIGIFIFGLS